jgi:esterase/lipase superfamily enzyme/HEAT repeat protein
MRTIVAILFALLLATPSILTAEPPTYRGRTVEQWSDDLSHPHTGVRLEAAKMLGKLGQHAEQAVNPLIAALRDRNPDVRMFAATALGRIGHQPEECLAALTKLLQDDDEHVRFSAEWSLARIAMEVAKLPHTKEEIDALQALLATAEKSLAKTARNLNHLQQVADAHKTLMSTDGMSSDGATLLASLQSDDRVIQLKATYALGRWGHAKELVEAMQTLGEDEFLRWHLTQALIKIGEPAVPALIQAMRSKDELTAQQAIDSLKQMGPIAIEALPHLITMIEDVTVSADLRESAVWCVENLGPAARDAVRALVGILINDDPDRLVEASTRALRAIGPAARAAEPALIEILRSKEQLDQTRIAAARALSAINPNSNEAIDLLVELLNQHDDPFFVAGLADAVGAYGSKAAKVVPRLIKLVDMTSDIERQSIVEAIGNIGPAANPATSRLIKCLTENEELESVQVAAARSLVKLGPDSVIALAEQLEHPRNEVRQTIARALVEIGDRAVPAFKSLESRLNNRDEDADIQAIVTVALGQIGAPAKPAIPQLVRIMSDARQAVRVRAMAAVAIGQIDPGQLPMLIAAMKDDNPLIRVAAAYALQRSPVPHPDALPTLIRELDDDGSCDMAMQALSEFKLDTRSLLTEIMNDPTKEEDTRISCLNLISENGLDAVEQLLDALSDETLAQSAYWSLRDLGNDGLPLLVSAADNEEQFGEDVRKTIRNLVDELLSGTGAGDEDIAWTGGHALMAWHTVKRSGGAAPAMIGPETAPRMATTEPETILPPDSISKPDVRRGLNTDLATTVPGTGFKAVKVFYGTNRNRIQDGEANNEFQFPWYALLFIVSVIGGMIIYVVRQFRHGNNGRGATGIGAIILFSLAVDSIGRIQTIEQSSGPTYGTLYSTQVELGICEVTIPDVHEVGQLERPSIMRLQFSENPEQHIVLKQVQHLESEEFFAELKDELAQQGNSVLVFVHGYNVSFESAARRTAQMSHDLKFKGASAFYSWPSQAKLRHYRTDEKYVELSVNQLKTFLLDVSRRSGADTINLIAHSMGNRALVNALKEIEVESFEEGRLFNQVILAAPDIDADIFKERIAPEIINKARRITLYASSRDLALVASREFNSGEPRAGDAGADLVIVPGIDTIDVSAGASSLLGHSYYGDSTSVLHDIEFLLQNRPASERENLEPFPHTKPTHWLFRPVATARRDAVGQPWR